MSEISEKILNLINKKNISYGELSRITNIPKSALQRYATGSTEKIPLDRVEIIAKALNTSAAYLMGWEKDNLFTHPDIRPITRKKFPLIGRIACGEPIRAEKEFDTFFEASADIRADFCVTAQGDSMINARIFDGDIVFIKQQPIVDTGQIAAVVIDDEVTLKRFFQDGDTVRLVPENPTCRTQTYNNEELEQIHILGKAVAFMSTVR